MSVRLKMMALVLFVGVVPLVIASGSSLRVHRRTHDVQLVEMREKTAEQTARLVEQRLADATRSLALLSREAIHWSALSHEERSGALWLVYQQLDDIALVALLDSQGGWLQTAYSAAADSGAHPSVDETLLADGARLFPAPSSVSKDVVVGPPFAASPMIPILIRLEPGAERTSSPAGVGVVLSARSLCAAVSEAGGTALDVLLLDANGREICPSLPALQTDSALVAALQMGKRSFGYVAAKGVEMVASTRTIERGWTVVTRQPLEASLASSRRMRNQSLLWIGIGLLIACAAGLFLAREISEPVANLMKGAEALEGGRFTHRLAVTSHDEFGKLAETFNRMSVEVEKRDREIRTWNEELQRRVDERTRQLETAQAQLLQAQTIAAVTSLGAGVAHEMNSPLTTVLGATQLVLASMRTAKRERDVALLEAVELEAVRLQAIVRNLIDLTENYAGEGFRRVDVAALFDDALRPLEARLADAQVIVHREYTTGLEVMADGTQVKEALAQVLENARRAVAFRETPRLELLTRADEGGRLVRMTVRDNGKGMTPETLAKAFEPFFTTKDNWQGQGLGLTLAYRIVQRNHGTIALASTPGEGTTVTFTFPSAGQRAHLV